MANPGDLRYAFGVPQTRAGYRPVPVRQVPTATIQQGRQQHPGTNMGWGRFAKDLKDMFVFGVPNHPERPDDTAQIVNLAGLFVPGKGGGKGSYRMSQEDMMGIGDYLAGYTTRGDRLEKPLFGEGPYNKEQTAYLMEHANQLKQRTIGADALQKIESNLRSGTSYALPKYRDTMDSFVFDVMAMARNGKYRAAAKMVSDVASQFNGLNREPAQHLIKAQEMLSELSSAQNFGLHTEGPPVRGGGTEDKIRAAIQEHLSNLG